MSSESHKSVLSCLLKSLCCFISLFFFPTLFRLKINSVFIHIICVYSLSCIHANTPPKTRCAFVYHKCIFCMSVHTHTQQMCSKPLPAFMSMAYNPTVKQSFSGCPDRTLLCRFGNKLQAVEAVDFNLVQNYAP
jgi:hypothetical protein